jgi:Sulfotransferase family
MDAARLPNFFIVGAPKAATTSLHAYLGQHPQIYMSPVKETHFFCSEVRPENFKEENRARVARDLGSLQRYMRGGMDERRFGGLILNWEDYVALFRKAVNEIAIGEATPLYLWSRTAARNIAARFPRARIIINLRNPVDRAYSHYLHMLSAGVVRRSFREQIDANLRCRDKRFGGEWPFLELGHYYEQVTRYFREFPSSQIHISLHDDLHRQIGRASEPRSEFVAAVRYTRTLRGGERDAKAR